MIDRARLFEHHHETPAGAIAVGGRCAVRCCPNLAAPGYCYCPECESTAGKVRAKPGPAGPRPDQETLRRYYGWE